MCQIPDKTPEGTGDGTHEHINIPEPIPITHVPDIHAYTWEINEQTPLNNISLCTRIVGT